MSDQKKPDSPENMTTANAAYNTPYSAIEHLHDFGNSGAWERFVQHYSPLVGEIARRKGIRDQDDREHILTDVCLKLQHQFQQRRDDEENGGGPGTGEKVGYWLKERGKFRNWLWHLAEFKCLEFNRSRRRESDRQGKQITLAESPGSGEDGQLSGTQLADPVDQLERQLTAEFVKELLRQLFDGGKVKGRDARIFVARTIDEIPVEEVAKTHKTSTNNVYQVVHSVRAELRPMLDAYLEKGTSPNE